METRDDPNLILAYVEGELPEADARRFEQRLGQDASLASLVADLKSDRAALRSLPEEAPGSSPA
ncbi:MAG: transcriptional regulator, partial [Planctomycetota bacterium]